MKKIIYSNYTKFTAVILLIISIVSGVLTATDGIYKFFAEDYEIYNFESDFSESIYLSNWLDEPENVIFNVYHNLYEINPSYYPVETAISDENVFIVPNDGNTVMIKKEKPPEIIPVGKGNPVIKVNRVPNRETIEKNIEQRLNDLYCKDKINYCIKWNDKIFTNCGADAPEKLIQEEFYSYVSRNGAASSERHGQPSNNRYSSYLFEEIAQYDETSTITIASSIKDDVVEKYREIWERQESIVYNTFTETFFFVILSLLMLIYLICVCGKNAYGEQKTIWIDNIWTEVHIAFIVGFAVGFAAIFAMILDSNLTGRFPLNLMKISVGTASAAAIAVIITSLLSIVRNIKCKKFIESSIIFRIIRWFFRMFVKALVWLRNSFIGYRNLIFRTLSKKTGSILISMLFAYTAIISICCLFTFLNFILFALWIIIGFAFFGFACFVVSNRANDIDEIKKGVNEVRNGNVAYKIPELKSEDMKALANNINDIAKGLDESVSAKVKAEKLKTELITNVSHDLKTPITSIISYTELLSKIEDLPEEAKDYVSVISKKSERLKNLTQDLFDISKVQSGNENVVFEKLDAVLLINQSLGEHDSEIKKSELPFCIDMPQELFISADGRKMSRVISNLINNILKYTMKNTRVFITAYEKDEKIIMEFKNISSYPMDFKADEIVGRFVRGDKSRTADGNGLGLAIAKSYTEICNGTFEIILDGDMFKVLIVFDKIN